MDSILVGTPPVFTTCPEDVVPNGMIDTSDMLFILSQYGCTVNCSADVDGDDAVSIADILAVLSLFGLNCPE